MLLSCFSIFLLLILALIYHIYNIFICCQFHFQSFPQVDALKTLQLPPALIVSLASLGQQLESLHEGSDRCGKSQSHQKCWSKNQEKLHIEIIEL